MFPVIKWMFQYTVYVSSHVVNVSSERFVFSDVCSSGTEYRQSVIEWIFYVFRRVFKRHRVPAISRRVAVLCFQTCVQAVRSNWRWMFQVMQCAEVHLRNAAAYHEVHETYSYRYFFDHLYCHAFFSSSLSLLHSLLVDFCLYY